MEHKSTHKNDPTPERRMNKDKPKLSPEQIKEAEQDAADPTHEKKIDSIKDARGQVDRDAKH